MKSRARFSVLVVFLALLCFAPCAVGQNVTVAGSSVLNHAPFAFLTSAFGPGGPGSFLGGNQNNGLCGSQGGNGGWGWFFGSGDNKNKSCGPTPTAAVPEGGTSLMYLALAGLCCFGAMAYRMRRHESVSQTNS
ncbi:MAG: hypothetical protein ABSE28_11285 [Candidatus Sulfotelmatobacter sp.]|jgi:hypothetical protein